MDYDSLYAQYTYILGKNLSRRFVMFVPFSFFVGNSHLFLSLEMLFSFIERIH